MGRKRGREGEERRSKERRRGGAEGVGAEKEGDTRGEEEEH